MGTHRRSRRTELFLLRIWVDESSQLANTSRDEQEALQGRLQKVVNGEAREFHDWHSLKEALMIMLALQQDGNEDKS